MEGTDSTAATAVAAATVTASFYDDLPSTDLGVGRRRDVQRRIGRGGKGKRKLGSRGIVLASEAVVRKCRRYKQDTQGRL